MAWKFFTTIALVLVGTAAARADILVTPTMTLTGDVVRSSTDGITIKVGENELTLGLNDIQRADVKKPVAVDSGEEDLRSGKYAEAVVLLQPVVDKYAGLPLPWAEDSLLHLGDAQVAMASYADGKKTFDNFKALYPKSPRVPLLDMKYARILVEQHEPDKALALIQGILTPMLKRDYLTEEQEIGVAEGLVLLGDCQVAANQADEALDNYLRVITLFDVDTDRTAEAKFKAGEILEKHGNWKRAKQDYEDVVKESPKLVFADDAKKRLTEITKAHPE